MQQYFIDNIIDSNEVFFNKEQEHHIKNVLRMKNDDIVKVVDLNNQSFLVSLNINEHVSGTINKVLETYEEPVKITLVMGLLKGDKWDYLIQKCCELGVNEIIPMISSRCIAKVNDKFDKKLIRYNKIALEACEQSKRDHIVKVCEPISFKNIVNLDADLKLIAYENADNVASKLKNALTDNVKNIIVVIGPEGGFSQNEVDYLCENGYNCISLGNRILRAETAAMAAISNILFKYE